MLGKATNDLIRGASLYHVWIHQAYHEISSKYKRTALGALWIPGAMVATSLALAIVMGGIQGQNLQDVLPYVMGGILCWSLPGYILNDAPETYMSASNIIRNHAYPYSYYSFETVTRSFLMFAHNIIAYYISMALLSKLCVPHWSLLIALPLVYLNAFLWGSMVSMLAARFRDMRFLVPFMAQIIFFMTPVFWHPGNMKGWRTMLTTLNPFYGLLEILRSPLLGNSAPLIAWELSLVTLVVGALLWTFFFTSFRSRIAFWV